MVDRPKKSVLRGFRLTPEVHETLQKEAAAKGLSVNALVSQILWKYIEWDRYADRLGFVTITRDGFRRTVESLDDSIMPGLAQETGGRNPREATMFWFKNANLDTLLEWISLLCKYGKIGQFELQRDGRQYTITILHFMGEKISLYQKFFFDQAFRTIAHVTPRFEVSKNALVITFESKNGPL